MVPESSQNVYPCMLFPVALSIHQLAAQGEMVFLASRIEQGGGGGTTNVFFLIVKM